MQRWIWRGFHIELPDDWEMLRFSARRVAGRCAFADRYQFRAELSWKEMRRPADWQKGLARYAEDLAADGEEPSRADVGEWYGLEGSCRNQAHTRFSRHFAEHQLLLELVLFWPAGIERGLVRRILDSVGPEPAFAGRYQHWQAFGMDFIVSPGLHLDKFKVDPALTVLVFADASGRHPRQRFERLGMVSNWLKQPVHDWLRSRVGDQADITNDIVTEHSGHKVVSVGGMLHLGRLALPWQKQQYAASAWICPNDHRLYCLTNQGRPNQFDGGIQLSCCQGNLLDVEKARPTAAP